ncbi:hypothetical protein Skr01_04790 [Sphaerisporangium krabiense]|nr:hypothetical protein Skr01_04790 [Sphaerisporangium krabiense]
MKPQKGAPPTQPGWGALLAWRAPAGLPAGAVTPSPRLWPACREPLPGTPALPLTGAPSR